LDGDCSALKKETEKRGISLISSYEMISFCDAENDLYSGIGISKSTTQSEDGESVNDHDHHYEKKISTKNELQHMTIQEDFMRARQNMRLTSQSMRS